MIDGDILIGVNTRQELAMFRNASFRSSLVEFETVDGLLQIQFVQLQLGFLDLLPIEMFLALRAQTQSRLCGESTYCELDRRLLGLRVSFLMK